MAEAYSEDETPTKPNASGLRASADLLKLIQGFDTLAEVECRHALRLFKAWLVCSTDQRILIEEVARELASKNR